MRKYFFLIAAAVVLLDRVAKNETFVNLARERAARLADTLRKAAAE